MTKSEYYSVVKKYRMKRFYNNHIECKVIGHYAETKEPIPELESAMKEETKKSNVYVTREYDLSFNYNGYTYVYHVFPRRSVLGKVPHGVCIDGVIYDG